MLLALACRHVDHNTAVMKAGEQRLELPAGMLVPGLRSSAPDYWVQAVCTWHQLAGNFTIAADRQACKHSL